jgi:hypothetical protein
MSYFHCRVTLLFVGESSAHTIDLEVVFINKYVTDMRFC